MKYIHEDWSDLGGGVSVDPIELYDGMTEYYDRVRHVFTIDFIKYEDENLAKLISEINIDFEIRRYENLDEDDEYIDVYKDKDGYTYGLIDDFDDTYTTDNIVISVIVETIKTLSVNDINSLNKIYNKLCKTNDGDFSMLTK